MFNTEPMKNGLFARWVKARGQSLKSYVGDEPTSSGRRRAGRSAHLSSEGSPPAIRWRTPAASPLWRAPVSPVPHSKYLPRWTRLDRLLGLLLLSAVAPGPACVPQQGEACYGMVTVENPTAQTLPRHCSLVDGRPCPDRSPASRTADRSGRSDRRKS